MIHPVDITNNNHPSIPLSILNPLSIRHLLFWYVLNKLIAQSLGKGFVRAEVQWSVGSAGRGFGVVGAEFELSSGGVG